MSPPPLATLLPPPVYPTPTLVNALWLKPGMPVEGTLENERSVNLWRFYGRQGQSAAAEMWLHPGAGSSVDAELVTQLLTLGDIPLAEERGSVFLPPYIFLPQLPADGLYTIRVMPASGRPGLYSLLLTLTDGTATSTTGISLTAPYHGSAAELFPTPFVVEPPAQFQWPTPKRRISGWTFHDPGHPGHVGLDIAADLWDPIVAVADGTVVFAEWGGGYGNLVIVQHGDHWSSYYAHLTAILVEVGQKVRQGELLGGAGSTGYSTGTHLHFELRYQGRPVDPLLYLPRY
ncbi:MAG: M23 family metallopeptidase [Anaerolineae bacterium]|nr:M23 family metallopeptidase [Anaerolineae bacterium]